MTHIFLDTNIFLEFKSFYEIQWNKIVNDDYKIMVPLVVLNELDKHKTSNNRKKSDRAKRVTKKIESIVDGNDNFKKLDLIYYQPEDIYFTNNNFDKQQQDDRLLATILSFLDKNPGLAVKLISFDTGARLRAKQLGISTNSMPEQYLIPAEIDESSKQVEKLNKELLALKNRLPALSICFKNDLQYFKANLIDKSAELDNRTNLKLQQILAIPDLTQPQEDNLNKSPIQIALINATRGFNKFSEQQILNYNKALKKYKNDYEAYLLILWDYNYKKANTVELIIKLKNNGSMPGTDIDVKFHFPDGFELYDSDSYPVAPEPPKEPYRPSSGLDLNTTNIIIPDIDFSDRLPSSFQNFNRPSITKTNSYNVEFSLTQLKHNHSHFLESLFIVYEKHDDVKSFNITYEITIGNHPEKINGNLNVILNE